MHIYIHEGAGHYIGSTIIVEARGLDEATQLVAIVLKENGLEDEPNKTRLLIGTPHTKGRVLFVDDGNY